MNWKLIEKKYIYNHQYFKARADVLQMPNGKIFDPYFTIELPTCISALALDVNDNVILVRQYRHPIEKELIELPGGFVEENEDLEEAARRELLEETGYQFNEAVYLGKAAANPGILSNYTHFYLLKGGKKIQEQMLDDKEDIEILLMPLNEFHQFMNENKMEQALHISCYQLALKYLEPL